LRSPDAEDEAMTSRSRRTRRTDLTLLALAVAAALGLAAPAAAQVPATADCPSTFHVLHDDRIGQISLPAGQYRVTVTGVTCPSASDLFARFLQDWDGVLPRPWSDTSPGAGTATFRRGTSGAQFTVTWTSGGGGGGGLACPASYRVQHTERIGPLVVTAGRYRIVLLGATGPTCAQAATLLTGFLEDFDGQLPGGWVLLAQTATFVRGSVVYGFRIKPWTGGGGGGGGGSKVQTRCRATFRVLHRDRIGRLVYPAGPYRLNVRGVSCATAASLFRSFLDVPSGRLPGGWRIQARTGTFVRRSASVQAKPAFAIR
jgi:hypothetical protein